MHDLHISLMEYWILSCYHNTKGLVCLTLHMQIEKKRDLRTSYFSEVHSFWNTELFLHTVPCAKLHFQTRIVSRFLKQLVNSLVLRKPYIIQMVSVNLIWHFCVCKKCLKMHWKVELCLKQHLKQYAEKQHNSQRHTYECVCM